MHIRDRSLAFQRVSEPAIYGVILVAGLVVIVEAEALWLVLVKALATLMVFWIAHIYAGVVSRLGDADEESATAFERLATAVRHAFTQSWGMLLAGLIPAAVLVLGVLKVLNHQQAIWGALWLAVGVLAVLGWVGVAAWSAAASRRLLGATLTALLGVALIALKVFVH